MQLLNVASVRELLARLRQRRLDLAPRHHISTLRGTERVTDKLLLTERVQIARMQLSLLAASRGNGEEHDVLDEVVEHPLGGADLLDEAMAREVNPERSYLEYTETSVASSSTGSRRYLGLLRRYSM